MGILCQKLAKNVANHDHMALQNSHKYKPVAKNLNCDHMTWGVAMVESANMDHTLLFPRPPQLWTIIKWMSISQGPPISYCLEVYSSSRHDMFLDPFTLPNVYYISLLRWGATQNPKTTLRNPFGVPENPHNETSSE